MDARIVRAAWVSALAVGACLIVAGAVAQEADRAPVALDLGGHPPAAVAPLPAATPPPATAMAPVPDASAPDAADNQADNDQPANKVVALVGPPVPARAQAAVLRVLDKVSAETMAFAAPIGARVRYKNLVFEVKTCVTRGGDDPQPRPSAYLLITSDAGAASGGVMGPRQVFKGWMFANAPGLNALKHPVYDAWLVSCSAATPAT